MEYCGENIGGGPGDSCGVTGVALIVNSEEVENGDGTTAAEAGR